MTMRNVAVLMAGLVLLATPTLAFAQEQSFRAGDGTEFTLPLVDGLPGRAESERAVFEAAGFDTDTAAAPTLTDRFSFLFKGGEQPLRVRVEDVTLAAPVLIGEVSVPEDLPGAGFRRSRFEMRAAPCAIARGEPCSAWMFGDQPNRIYRATLVFEGGDTETLLQAEPYQMGAFIARLGDRIPESSAGAPDRTAEEQQ
jgi:hypothetical protein